MLQSCVGLFSDPKAENEGSVLLRQHLTLCLLVFLQRFSLLKKSFKYPVTVSYALCHQPRPCVSLICSTLAHPATHSGPLPPSTSTVLQRVLWNSLPLKISVFKPLVLFPDHDVAINRYSRLSKKRDNDKV